MSTTISRGVIEQVNHPIIIVRGLQGVKPHDLVETASGLIGQVYALKTDTVQVLLFSTTSPLVGEGVSGLGKQLTITVGDHLAGASINALGVSLDTKEKLPIKKSQAERIIDHAVAPIQTRLAIETPLQSGVALVDLLVPIGQGQRELIVGDRKTGKTTFLIQTMRSHIQAGGWVVYAAIGKKGTDVKELADTLKKDGLTSQTCLVAARADDPAALIRIAPFTAMTIAEYWHELGRDVLVIFDDLSTHAKFVREIALVSGQFPGRDSYPGDIFYLHARLLERAGCYRDETHTAGSITCLPVAETQESDLTNYIVSNLISITDGHILFDSSLFSQGRRPAIHIGLSVTRVGKQTQMPIERSLGQLLNTFFASYTKAKELAHFGAELSVETQALITKGEHLLFFFNQQVQESLPRPLQVLLAMSTYLGWFDTLDGIEGAKKNLMLKYKKSHILSDMVAALEGIHTADQLEEYLTLRKDQFLQVCQL